MMRHVHIDYTLRTRGTYLVVDHALAEKTGSLGQTRSDMQKTTRD
jgi:hypothetical protein